MPSSLVPRTRLVSGPDGPLAVQQWGEASRGTIVLIHGYPDHSGIWSKIAPLLADQWHVVAYDVRGAGASFVPAHTADYRLPRLVADLRVVIDATSPDRPVHLVAHDWGSIQGWEAVTDPALRGRIASYSSCSGPCLDHAGHWMRDRLRRPTPRHLAQYLMQGLRSWYIAFFHLPVLPTVMWHTVMGPHWSRWMRWLERTPAEPRAGQTADGVRGMRLYRANMLPRMLRPGDRHAHAPVQVIVPLRDRYVGPALSDPAHLARWVPQLHRVEVDAGHWLPLQQPALFARLVRGFVRRVERQQRQATGQRIKA